MPLDKRNLYRLPWSLNDNAIAWLEVTDICNLACEGCYRQHISGHKSLKQIQDEILFFKQWRNPDNVSIAGGEPLIHPQIIDVVAFIRQQGMKPVVLTNAMALTPELLRELKRAGLEGFTIHIDSHQGRPHWDGKTEGQLNDLRQHYAEMCARERKVSVTFNSTVYPSTYREIPDVMRWGRDHMDIVNGLVFITYRTAPEDGVAYGAAKEEVNLSQLSYGRDPCSAEFVTSPEVHQILQETCPEYDASAYLGGTMVHTSYKWLLGAMIGTKGRAYGSVGKRSMEFVETGHHWFKGTYLAYTSSLNGGRKTFLMSALDPEVRRATGRWLGDVVRHPGRLFEPVRVMSIGIIQAPDLQPDGRADMCDSCPDMTVWDGKLVNSCRMDEYRLFGGFVTVVQKGDKAAQPAAPPASEREPEAKPAD